MKFFIDDLDGEWTVGMEHDDGSTQSIITLSGDDDWVYPDDILKQIGFELPYVLNVYQNGGDKPEVDVYSVPDNWRSLVTQNNGVDHLPSIHDVMKLI